MRLFKLIIVFSVFNVLTTSLAFSHGTVVLMTHDSFNISEKTLADFEEKTGIKTRLLKGEDTIETLEQATLTKDKPLADVFFGVDNTNLSRAINANIFEPYRPPGLADVDDKLKLDPEFRLTPVDYGDVCLNYDKKWFAQNGIDPPQGLEQLIEPKYKALTVIQNPATSSPGLAFLFTTVSRFGKEGFLDYWKKLRDNDVKIVNGWEDAYYSHFSLSGGDRPIVVSYASSPPAEVFFSEEPFKEAPTVAVTGNGSAFRQIEFVGVLRGAANPEGARKLIDFMLDITFQEDIPLNMFVYPANKKAQLPDVFVQHSHQAEKPAVLSYEEIARHQAQWLKDWTEVISGK